MQRAQAVANNLKANGISDSSGTIHIDNDNPLKRIEKNVISNSDLKITSNLVLRVNDLFMNIKKYYNTLQILLICFTKGYPLE